MNIALTRSGAGYRVEFHGSRADAPVRDLGELTSKILIVTLFSFMASAIAQDTARSGHATGLLLVVSEALVVALTIARRSAGAVDRTARARLLTLLASIAPPMVRPAALAPLGSESITIFLSGIGLIVVVLGKLSLGRSFGLTPANRGVVCRGVYRFVRHPIYLGYVITHVGFLLASPSAWNLAVLIAADAALMFRAICEEETLAQDPAYRTYRQRVRWRLIPGVF